MKSKPMPFNTRSVIIGDGVNRSKLSIHTTGAFTIVHQYSGTRCCLADASRLTDVRASLTEIVGAIDAFIAREQDKNNG